MLLLLKDKHDPWSGEVGCHASIGYVFKFRHIAYTWASFDCHRHTGYMVQTWPLNDCAMLNSARRSIVLLTIANKRFSLAFALRQMANTQKANKLKLYGKKSRADKCFKNVPFDIEWTARRCSNVYEKM